MAEKETSTKMPFGIEWGFGIGNFFMQLIVSISASYFTFVMTDVFMLDTTIAATVNSVSSITGIVGLFLFAGLFQYTNLKWGRYRSWIMILTPLLVVGYVGMYIPWNMSPSAWCAMLVIFFILADLGASGIGVCCSSLMTKCAGSTEGRMLIMARQNVLHNTSRVIGGAIVIPLVTLIGGSKTSPIGYAGYFLIFSVLTLASYFWLAGSVKEYDPYDPSFHTNKANKVSIGDMLKALATNPHLLALFLGKVASGMLTLSSSLGAYFFTYVCGNLSYFAVYNTLSPFGGILGGILSPYFAKKFDKKKLFIATVGFQVYLCYLPMTAMYFITGTVNPLFACIMLSLGFCSNNISLTYFNTFYMDCAEYSFWKTGKDITPIIMTLSKVPQKLSRGVGASLGVLLLGIAGYKAGEVQSTYTLNWIVFLFTCMPAVAQSVMFLFMGIGYKLTNEKVNEIIAENKITRAKMKEEADKAKGLA